MKGCESRCPGCEHRDWPAARSEQAKAAWLARALSPWNAALEPVRGAGASRRWGYREKATLAAEWRGQRWVFGTRLKRERGGKEGDLIPIPDCPIQSPRTNAILNALAEELAGPERVPLVFAAISGELATIVLKSAPNANGFGLNELFRDPERAVRSMACAGVRGLFANFNPAAGRRVISSRGWKLLWGSATARAGDWVHGPESFQQPIAELHADALSEAARFLAPGPGDRVVDLCSGIGASLAAWRARGADALGVELSGEAVRCAELNAGPGLCLRGRASERLPQLQAWIGEASSGHDRRLLAFTNPPRTGLEESVARWLVHQARPELVAYLSCSAGTLARDLGIFASGDYVVKRIIPYDFFPQTRHVETLACLELGSRARFLGIASQRGAAGAER